MKEALNPILFSSWCRISKMAIVFVPDHSDPQRSHFTYHLPKSNVGFWPVATNRGAAKLWLLMEA